MSDSDYDSAPLYHGEDDDRDEKESTAGIAPRTCTDVLCALIFISFLGGMVYLAVAVFPVRGDIRRLSHGFNFHGDLCGVDAAVADRKYLFFCRGDFPSPSGGDPMTLDLQHPLCVETCPTTVMSQHLCHADTNKRMQWADPACTDKGRCDFSMITDYSYASKQDYKTIAFADRYCVPDLPNSQVAASVFASFENSTMTRYFLKLQGVRSGYPALLLSAGLAIVFGYLYLLLLRTMAGALVHGAIAVLILGSLGAGGYMIGQAMNPSAMGQALSGAVDLAASQNILAGNTTAAIIAPSTGDPTWDMIIGITCLIVGLVFIVVVCCFRHTIEVAIGCVEAAAEAVFAMPSLLLQPAIELAVRMSVLSVLVYGLLWVASCGELLPNTFTVNGVQVMGLSRTYSADGDVLYMALYWIFGIFWCMEFLHALSQFVVSYSVVLWYFTRHIGLPCCIICKGWMYGLSYHFGTIALGSFLVAVCRVIQAVLGYIAKQADKDGNAALACCAKVLLCCITCFTRFIEFVNKNAYMDVAVRSTSFCRAAKNALTLIVSNAGAVAILNGACFVFQVAGTLSITTLGVYVTYIVITTQETFTSNASPYFIPDPVFVAGISGLICLTIALAFMMIFDQTADTLLYCYAWEAAEPCLDDNGEAQYFAPDGLKALLEKHS